MPAPARPYKVICISVYADELEALDCVVEDLKRRGMTRANRSALIRVALRALDVERVEQKEGLELRQSP